MDTLLKCWTSCIPTCSSCMKCPCRLGRNRNRVGPSQPIKVIVASNLEESSKTPGNSEQKHKHNGETNLHFQGDEVTFSPGEFGSNLDITDNGSINNTNGVNGHSSCNGECPHSATNATPSTSGLDLDVELTKAYYAFLTTVYIQLTKEKKIRVINIKPPHDHLRRKASSQESRTESGDCSGDSSDEEEYWFTRWSRKPKLKNVFKPKPENIGEDCPIRVPVQLNSKFKYEEIQEEKEAKERMSLKGLLRKNSGSSLAESSSQPQSSNVSNSQNDANYFNAICSGRSREDLDVEGINSASDSFTRNYSSCSSQLELVPSQESQNPESDHGDSVPAFTNFAFQPDPEDEDLVEENPQPPLENMKTDEEDIAHFEADIHASTRRHSTELTDLLQIKLNGNLERSGSFRSIRSSRREQTKSCDTEKKVIDEEAEESKPILFLVHGISGSCDTWKSQFEYFHDYGYEIIAPDVLGHGMSSTPNAAKHYLFESLVQDITHVFDHFVTEEKKAIVVGHGYGACLGTVLSRIRPKSVSLLISVSGGGPTPMVPPGCFETPLHRLNVFTKKRSTGRFDNPDLKNVLPPKIHQYIIDGQLWLDGDAAFHRRISVPTLLVYGMRDKVVSMIEECEMERTIPKAFLELIPTAGHMVMWEEPKKFNKMLIKFIQTWTQ